MNITIVTRTIARKWRSTDTVTYSRAEYEECFSADRRARLDSGEMIADGPDGNGLSTLWVNATALAEKAFAEQSTLTEMQR